MITKDEMKDFFKWLTYYLQLTWNVFKESKFKIRWLIVFTLLILGYILIPRTLILIIAAFAIWAFYIIDRY